MFRPFSKLKLKRRLKKKGKPLNSSPGDNSTSVEKSSDISLQNSSENTIPSDSISKAGTSDEDSSVVVSDISVMRNDPFKQGPSSPRPDNTLIPNNALPTVYTLKHADEDRLFREEFNALRKHVKGLKRNFSKATREENRTRNRYRNIVTCDESRVVLKKDKLNNDYINASYIDGYGFPRKFIASQGPKEVTLNDFWRMVWEQNSYTIIMITELRENAKPAVNDLPSPFKPFTQQKCDKYWPDKGSIAYGSVHVEHMSTYEFGGFLKRNFRVHHDKEDEIRIVCQFHYRAWPDHGVPKTTSELFRFRWHSLSSQPRFPDAGPIVVHCSAGVGRTGSFIGLDFLLMELREKQSIDVCELVISMRKKRTDMVQSLDQYSFLHKLILEWYLFGDTDIPCEKFLDVHSVLKKFNPKFKRTGFQRQFGLLEKCVPPKRRFTLGKSSKNKSKNRDQEVMTYDHSAVTIKENTNENSSPYINASNLECYDHKCTIIATQDPLPSTRELFWRMVVDNNVNCVVMLSSLAMPTNDDSDDSSSDDEPGVETCPKYWPTAGSMEYGEITIDFQSSIKHKGYVSSHLTVESSRGSVEVTHIRVLNWDAANVLPMSLREPLLELGDFVGEQLTTKQNDLKTKVVIHCHDGASKTGMLCALVNILDRFEREDRIDIFRAVKDIRDFRPLMVRTEEQYELLYDLMKFFIMRKAMQGY